MRRLRNVAELGPEENRVSEHAVVLQYGGGRAQAFCACGESISVVGTPADASVAWASHVAASLEEK